MNCHVFRMYDIRGKADRDFPGHEMVRLARAMGTYFRQRGEDRVIVARDNRSHSPRLSHALTRELVTTGLDVLDIGETITPVFYFSHHLYHRRAGVMITGSHNPPEDNGFKIYLGAGTIHGEEILRIRAILEEGDFLSGEGSSSQAYPEDQYIARIASGVRLDRPLKVVADGGNGTAGPVAVRLLGEMGCDVIPLYCESDPTFPHHHPDPTVVTNLRDLIDTVRREGADLGVSYDGDGDRLGVVDDQGHIVWGDILQVLFWREILPRYPGSMAIVEVKCSKTLFEELQKLGAKPFYYKTGHSLIKAKMRETGIPFAGEMSGHFFFADEYFGYDDALYATARLLRILARGSQSLSGLLGDLPVYYSTPETRVPCPDDIKRDTVAAITQRFREEGHTVIDVDGARIEFPTGWGLVRASNTEPVLVARCEARSTEDLRHICGVVKEGLLTAGVGDFHWELPADQNG
ncbi:MAG: phosphomannomutase/phosphoglucomutase [Bacillota bacterium]